MMDKYNLILNAEFSNVESKSEDFEEIVDEVLNITWKISIERTLNTDLNYATLNVTVKALTLIQNLNITQYEFTAQQDGTILYLKPNMEENALTMNQFKLISQTKIHDVNCIKLNVSLAMNLQEKPNFSVDYRKLLKNQTFADFTIKCKMDGKEFKVHKLVLAARSSVFYSMLESDFKEAKSNLVEIPDIDSTIMKIVLTYIYSGKLTETHKWFDLYVAADKYQIEDLMNHCIRYLMANMDASNLIDGLKIAEIFGETKLGSKISKYIVSNSSCDSPVRKLIQTNDWKNFLHDYPSSVQEIMQYQMQTIEELKNKMKALK